MPFSFSPPFFSSAAPPSPFSPGIGTLIACYLKEYFKAHGEDLAPCRDLHRVILQEVEKPLLIETLKYTKGNQCQAANILGLHRNTLRNKCLALGVDMLRPEDSSQQSQ